MFVCVPGVADRVVNPDLRPCLVCGLALVIGVWQNDRVVGTACLLSLISDSSFILALSFAFISDYTEPTQNISSGVAAQVPHCG